MPLSGTLKERLAQYKQLKEEEEQRERREAAARMLEDDEDEEDEFGTSFADDDDEAEYEEESYEEENEEAAVDGDIDEERGGNVFDVLEEGSTTSPEAATTDADVEQDEQEVFLALDEAERAEQYRGDERVGGTAAAAGVGITHVYTTHNNSNKIDEVEEGARTIPFPSDTLANTNGTVRSGAATAGGGGGGTGAITTGRRSTTSVAKSRSHGRTPEAKQKTYLLVGVVLVGCLAIVAIVLPFVFDYGRTNNKIQIITPPGPNPTPATTLAPTVLPAGNETEAEEEDEEELLLPANNLTESPTVTPTTVQWGQFLTTFLIPVSGDAVFADENSPQYRAAEYILADPYTAQLTTTEQLEDRYASMTMYYATHGANWTMCFLGDTTCPEGRQWLVGDTCTWYGITCNEEGRVTAYQFANAEGNGLVGTLPFEMYLLSSMTDLIIVNNTIQGTLPEAFGEQATHLRSLLLPDNELSGTIPNEYLKNSPLEFVHLGNNQLTGPIPTRLGGATDIQQLDLSGNGLTGSIPAQIRRYEALEALSLANNLLVGTIPKTLYESLTHLKFLHLNGNALSGTVSTFIGRLSSLKELRVGGSELGGVLPDEVYTLTRLQELDLSHAQFEGRLSLGFLNLESLEKLVVNDNKLDGTVPGSFGRLKSLSDLVLQGNAFSGSMPDSICSLRDDQLQVLTADCQNFTCDCCTACF